MSLRFDPRSWLGRRERPRGERLLLAIPALALVLLVSCDHASDSYALSAAGAQPANVWYIGPQPGPDRPVPHVANPYTGDKAALLEGRKLFTRYNCAGCHGDHAGGGMGPSLRDTTWIYGGEDANIFASITEGRAYGMPAWGSKLPQGQIWKIAAYIKSLRTPDEPEPPR